MVGLVGLDDRATRPLPAARSTDRLDEQLVGPLRRPLVGQVERDVSRHDADQRDRRDVQALGDEARADEDVEAAVAERIEHALRRAAPLGHVSIQAPDAQARRPLADLPLEPLGAAAEIADPGRGAVRAAGRQRASRRPAVVAAQGRAGLVVDERPLALRARLDVPAVAAQDDRRATRAG